MSEIEKLRVLHDAKQAFVLPDHLAEAMARQIDQPHRAEIERFFRCYEIEDWFGFIFPGLPWVVLSHELGQLQLPSESKATYQVPDYLVICETSMLTHQSVLVEVKRVSGTKRTLKLPKGQVALLQAYSRILDQPLVFAIYWEVLNAWTVNTPDSFEETSSKLRMTLPLAHELDCALLFGDISFFIHAPMERRMVYSKNPEGATDVRHKEYGFMVSDSVGVNETTPVLIPVESAALDCIFDWIVCEVVIDGDTSTVIEQTKGFYMLKSSPWMTRHLAMLQTRPDEAFSKMSFKVIALLMEKLGFRQFLNFPWDSKVAGIEKLSDRFFGKEKQ